MIIEIALIIGLIIDLVLTYHYLKFYRERFPKKDYLVIESNPLIRSMVGRYGLVDGIVFSGFIILVILIILIAYTNTNFKFFLGGVYYMMIVFHLTNFLALKRMKGGKENGKTKKRSS